MYEVAGEPDILDSGYTLSFVPVEAKDISALSDSQATATTGKPSGVLGGHCEHLDEWARCHLNGTANAGDQRNRRSGKHGGSVH